MVWPELKRMPWKLRNAAVIADVRAHLEQTPASMVFSTMQIAALFTIEDQGGLAHLLTRLAPHMSPYATHDGPEREVVRYGRKRIWRAWQWRGQRR